MIYSGEWVYYIPCGQKDKWHFVWEKIQPKLSVWFYAKGILQEGYNINESSPTDHGIFLKLCHNL